MSIVEQSNQTTLFEYTEGKTVNRKLKQLDKPYTDAQVLRYLYWDSAMSTYQIADKLNAGESTILRWMKRHGIERRNDIEAAEMRKLRDGPFRCQQDNTSGETDSSTESKWSFQD